MRGSVIRQLIVKDWQLQRLGILITIVWGLVALGVCLLGKEAALVVGGVFFFISLILVGTMLPMASIVNERKKQNLAFLMSLPVSYIQYTTAKLISTLLMFLGPWLTLVAAGLILIEVRGVIPRGSIPLMLLLALLPFIGLALITAAGLVGESEGWGIAANVFCSSVYGLTWYFMTRIPGLMAPAQGRTVVWNSTELKWLGSEFGLVVVILALTYYLQSRKRDFV